MYTHSKHTLFMTSIYDSIYSTVSPMHTHFMHLPQYTQSSIALSYCLSCLVYWSLTAHHWKYVPLMPLYFTCCRDNFRYWIISQDAFQAYKKCLTSVQRLQTFTKAGHHATIFIQGWESRPKGWASVQYHTIIIKVAFSWVCDQFLSTESHTVVVRISSW